MKIKKKKIEILFIGSFKANNFYSKKSSLINQADLNISGTVISLKNTYKKFQNISNKTNLFNLKYFDTNSFRDIYNLKFNIKEIFLNNKFLKILRLIFQTIKADSILINTSPHGLAYQSFVVLIAFFLRKKCVLRIFGGREPLDVQFYLRPLIYLSFLCCSSAGIQSKSTTKKYKILFSDEKIFWLPTARKKPKEKYLNKRKSLINKFSGSFFYLGHIRKDKGIEFLVEAFKDKRLSSFKLDIYGPIWGQLEKKDILNKEIFKDISNINYYGPVLPDKVNEIIASHDALIFPTISPAEGYPGTVIESLMIGTPVLASRWLYLPEILNQNNSILFRPFSKSSIIKAVQKYSKSKKIQEKLSKGCLFSAKTLFSLDKQSNILLNQLGIRIKK